MRCIEIPPQEFIYATGREININMRCIEIGAEKHREIEQ